MEQERKGVVFKGSTEGLTIVVPEQYSVASLMADVSDKIHAAARFFQGAKLKVTYRGITLTPEEEQALYDLLMQKSGAVIESVGVSVEETDHKSRKAPAVPSSMMKSFFAKNPDEGDCKFVRHTVRGGTRIQYNGSVVVLGDVNPGAEIVAAKHVVVLGVLRGMVHAGADGSQDAFIYALKLKPTQLRIAEYIARCPEDGQDAGIAPEMATITDGVIYVNSVNERI